MRLSALLLAVLSLFAITTTALARSAPLVDPDPIAIPAGLTQEQVVKDIKRALIGRGWSITAEQPGKIDYTLHLRTHTARIQVTYNESQVRLAYVSSEELDYKEKKGVRHIHPNYLGWVGFLVNDINTNCKVSQGGG